MLTLTGIPECGIRGGPSQDLAGFQLQPGASDYPAGGYVIPGAFASSTTVTGKLASEFVYGAWIMNQNAAAAAYDVAFISSGGFGTTPTPQQTITMIVTLPSGSVSAGTPIGLSAASVGVSTTIGVTSNVITVTQPNTLSAGQFVYFQSTGAGAAIAGTILQVASATPTQWTANYPTPNITAATADITITYQLVQAAPGNLVTTGAVANITNSLATSSLITMTCANSFVPGQFVIIQGLTNGANANGVIVQIATASATQFTANWTGTSFTSAADVGTASLLVTAGGAPITTGASTSITNSVATASSAGTAGVVSLSAVNSYVPGNIVVIQGLTNGAAVNGDLGVVLATSLTNALFKFNHKTAAITTGSDAGTASILVTGTPTSAPQVSPGTDLSACTWWAEFLKNGL
jgi:hypothetical protein